jgi:hypothetical protein
MKCPSCGAEARDGSRFCMSCGVDLSAGQPPGLDPSEAETVIAPVLKPDAVYEQPATLGPASTPPPEPPPPPEPAAPPPEPAPVVSDAPDQTPTDQGGADDMSKSMMFPNELVDESAPEAIGPGGGYDDDEEPKKSKKGLIMGCLGCLGLICCSGLIAFVVLWVVPVYFASNATGGADSQWAEFETSSWGEIKLTTEAKVYASNSTGASVLEDRISGDKLEYYGFDDSFEFYKVKTGGGTDGYVELMKAEIAFDQ